MGDSAPCNSRRHFLLGAAALPLATLLFTGEALAGGGAARQGKDAVNYQDSPKNGEQCSDCRFFQKPDACQLVKGRISSSGWCMLYTRA